MARPRCPATFAFFASVKAGDDKTSGVQAGCFEAITDVLCDAIRAMGQCKSLQDEFARFFLLHAPLH
jgi:hypothetical protein